MKGQKVDKEGKVKRIGGEEKKICRFEISRILPEKGGGKNEDHDQGVGKGQNNHTYNGGKREPENTNAG